MNLEDVLGKIQTDRANLHVDGLLICASSPTILYGTRCRERTGVHSMRLMTIEDSRDDDRSDPPRWYPLADEKQADLTSIGA